MSHLCMCNHDHSDHVIEEAGGYNVCQIEDCGCKCYDHCSPEKIFRMLNHMEKLMTNVDIDMMEWQGHLDMAKMASEGLLFELWTNDIPPKKVTAEVVEQSKGKPIRVMQRMNGQWDQVGTGVIDSDGKFQADITSDETMKLITREILSRMSFRKDLPPEPSPYETLVATPGSGVVEIPRVGIPPARPTPGLVEDLLSLPRAKMDLSHTKHGIKGFIPNPDDHEFFKETLND